MVFYLIGISALSCPRNTKSLVALSLASVPASVAAAKAKVEEAAGSPILDALQAMATDVYESTLGLAQDVAGLTLAAPRFRPHLGRTSAAPRLHLGCTRT